MKLNKGIGDTAAVVGKKGRIEFSQVSKLKLLISCALCAISLQLIVTFAAGEHALSEVWSESEGLQLKYSTNHDDLLGAKGSEMSLSTQQHKHEAANPQVGGSQTTSGDSSAPNEGQDEANQQASGAGQSDEAAESAPATPPAPEGVAAGGPSAESGSQQANSDEDNDNDAPSGESSSSAGAESQTADSRPKTERIPIAKQYIGAGSRSSSHSASMKPHQQQYSQETSKSHFRPYDGPETSSRKAKVDQDDDAPPSFNSALEQAEGADTANVDHGDDSESVRGHSETGAMRFRQPGKLFKQAVRMNEQQVDDEGGDEGAGGGAAAKGPGERQQQSNEEPAGAVPSGEPEFGPSSSLQGRNGNDQRQQQATGGSHKTRQNMIDFDRVVSSGRQTAAAEREAAGEQSDDGFASPPFGANQRRVQQQQAGSSEEADEEGGEFGGLFKAPQQSQNSFLLGHRPTGDRRAQMATSAGSNREARLHVSPRSPAGGQTQLQPQQPFFSAAAKSLAYFKSQQQHQQTGRARNSLLEAQMAIPAPAGPDSVRDNFISPGHFPGSMPHLTQAASETKKKQLEPSAPPEVALTSSAGGGGSSKRAEVDSSSSASSSVALLVEEAQESSQPAAQSSSPAVLKESNKQPAGASDSAFVAAAAEVASTIKSSTETSRVQPDQRQAVNLSRFAGQPVTPEPEVQPESQQIMAPILLSTTTMAPLVATGEPTVSVTATTTTSTASPTTTTTTTTSQAPYLQRFKFRKYR